MPFGSADLEARFAAPFGTFRLNGLSAGLTHNLLPGRRGSINRIRRAFAKQYFRLTKRFCDVEYRQARLRLMPCENAVDMQLSLFGQNAEESEISTFETLLADADVVVDIGANVGLYSILAGRVLSGKGRVIAFEPHPRTAIKLKGNIALNALENIEVIQKGIGDAAGTLPLQTVSLRDAGRNSMVEALNRKGLDVVEVEISTLLDELNRLGVERVDILKIDVEGFEDRALLPFFETAPKSLWPHHILMEIEHRAYWELDLVVEMKSKGYALISQNGLNCHLQLNQVPHAG